MNRQVLVSVVLIFASLLSGCASMDLKVDTLPISNEYGKIAPRVDTEKCWAITQDPGNEYYDVYAKLIVQEQPTMIAPISTTGMICHASKIATSKGADAVIVDDMSTTNVAGNYARTSPVIKLRAIRFKGGRFKLQVHHVKLAA